MRSGTHRSRSSFARQRLPSRPTGGTTRRCYAGLGVEPTAPKLEDVKVGTTRENLEVPIKGESQEQEEMYPAMVKQARRDNVPAAVTSFTYALDTEGEHARLFRDALAQLGHNPPADYYVGEVSGDTVTRPTQKEPYRKVD